MLQTHWSIVHGTVNIWDPKTLWEVMIACVIMHNVIVEDEGNGVRNTAYFEKVGVHVYLEQEPQHVVDLLLMHQKL